LIKNILAGLQVFILFHTVWNPVFFRITPCVTAAIAIFIGYDNGFVVLDFRVHQEFIQTIYPGIDIHQNDDFGVILYAFTEIIPMVIEINAVVW